MGDFNLADARAVFARAVRKRRVPANRFEGCIVEVPRTIHVTRAPAFDQRRTRAKTRPGSAAVGSGRQIPQIGYSWRRTTGTRVLSIRRRC
jgi:hypothetical protein